MHVLRARGLRGLPRVVWLLGVASFFNDVSRGGRAGPGLGLVGQGLRGRAYGWYHGAIGAGALPAGLFTGWLWESFGSRTALLACAAFASVAALGLAASPSLRRPPR